MKAKMKKAVVGILTAAMVLSIGGISTFAMEKNMAETLRMLMRMVSVITIIRNAYLMRNVEGVLRMLMIMVFAININM